MLTNLLYLKKQLIKEDIEKYLKRISTLIRRDEVKRIEKKIILKYIRTNKKVLETT